MRVSSLCMGVGNLGGWNLVKQIPSASVLGARHIPKIPPNQWRRVLRAPAGLFVFSGRGGGVLRASCKPFRCAALSPPAHKSARCTLIWHNCPIISLTHWFCELQYQNDSQLSTSTSPTYSSSLERSFFCRKLHCQQFAA